mgnify:CR=1 FL=1
MFLHIQNVLTPEEIAFFRQSLGADAPWVDGARSAGGQALHQKNNLQLSQASELSAQLQAKVKAAVHRSALFFSAALPRRIFNPLFNNYGDGANYYGNHVDSAVMLNAKLKAGVTLMHVLAMTRSLGERLTPEGDEPEQFRWTDASDSSVTASFHGGRLREWALQRPSADAAPADPGAGTPP